MFEQGLRPGSGMRSATSNLTGMWSLEIRFPILSSLSERCFKWSSTARRAARWASKPPQEPAFASHRRGGAL